MDRYAFTGEKVHVHFWLFTGLLCKTLYFQHYNLPTTTSPSPLLAGIIPQVNIRTSCKVPVIRQAVDLSSVLPVVSDCLIMAPHNFSNNPTHRERQPSCQLITQVDSLMLLSFNQSLLLLLNNSDSTLTLYMSWANFWIMKYFQVCFCMFNRYELGFPTYQILTQSYSNKRPIYIFSSLGHQNSNNLVTCLFTPYRLHLPGEKHRGDPSILEAQKIDTLSPQISTSFYPALMKKFIISIT